MKILIEDFKHKCIMWEKENPTLKIVYNNDLDSLKQQEIKFILVADNPGKEEEKLSRFLVGTAGIAARVFFERALVDDFKKEVLVLNKTPIHTNQTDQLKAVNIVHSVFQKYMVKMIVDLHNLLGKPIIISGYSNGIIKAKDKFRLNNKSLRTFFEEFAEAVKSGQIKEYYIISHFSRNMFYNSSKIDDYEKAPENIFWEQGKTNRDMFEKGCVQ